MQSVLEDIHAAARRRPAPDLIVLPGRCDCGGGQPDAKWRESNACAFAEAICWEARDWGVFVSLGIHCFREGRAIETTVLIDADGDQILSTADCVDRGDGLHLPTAKTPVGEIALGSAELLCDGKFSWGAHSSSTLLVLPLDSASGDDARMAADAVRTHFGAAIEHRHTYLFGAVVSPASSKERKVDGKSSGTFLVAPGGKVVAWAQTTGRASVQAEVCWDSVPGE